jgi:exosortase D (VPLPA-CTERM-specific)
MLAMALAILCFTLVCYTARDGVRNLYDRWMYEEEYGYGFVIVIIMPVLLWRRWNALTSGAFGSKWPGLVLLVAAQLSTIVAVLGESYFIEQLALFVSIAAIALIVLGMNSWRIITPLATLLLLTVPLPYTLEAMLTIKLQLLSTNIGVAIIQLLNIPVYVEGNIIDLGAYKLQVAEACSGLRYLLPLICISFLIAYLYRAPWWKKAVIAISAAPITIIINSFRIAVTAILVNNFGIRMAEGFFHQFEGWIVFLMGVILLGLEIVALEGFRWAKVQIESITERQHVPSERIVWTRRGLAPLALAVVICGGTLGATTSIASSLASAPNVTRDSFAGFPRQISEWTGQPIPIDSETLTALKDTDNFEGEFSARSGGAKVDLFVAYYDSLSKGAAIHSPRVCLPGSGWEFASFQERDFGELDPGVAGTYNYVLIQKGEQKMLMYYWYQQRERRTAGEFSMKYYLLVDSFFKSRKDGALVRLLTPIDAAAGDKGLSEANARLHAFAHATFAVLPKYLPE